MEKCAPENWWVFCPFLTFTSILVYSVVWNQSGRSLWIDKETLPEPDPYYITMFDVEHTQYISIIAYNEDISHRKSDQKPWRLLFSTGVFFHKDVWGIPSEDLFLVWTRATLIRSDVINLNAYIMRKILSNTCVILCIEMVYQRMMVYHGARL